MLRPLHYVLRISNRDDIKKLFTNVLGMKILRHEEFSEGCAATCNGPYDGKWSKTMIGYGDEDNHFVLELTYNYGISSYKMSNDMKYLKIKSSAAFDNVKRSNYIWQDLSTKPESIILTCPDGYKFLISKEDVSDDKKFCEVCLTTKSIEKSLEFYTSYLPGDKTIADKTNESACVDFKLSGSNMFRIRFDKVINEDIVKTSASGRIAFSYTGEVGSVEKKMQELNQKILTNLVTLDTPGKASVQVVILLDPNNHEICIVNDDGFRDLSKMDPNSTKLLQEAMNADKSNEWFSKHGGKKAII